MKQYYSRLAVFLILFLFSDQVWAEDGEFTLVCPGYTESDMTDLETGLPRFFRDKSVPKQERISVRSIIEKNVQKCGSSAFEDTMSKLFLVEKQRLNTIFSNIYADDYSPPEILVALSTHAVRESFRCHEIICTEILTQCTPDRGLQIANSFDRGNRCGRMKDDFLSFTKVDIHALLFANTDKKSQGIIREKIRWWETSFDILFVDKLVQLNRVIKVLEEKLSNFSSNLLG